MRDTWSGGGDVSGGAAQKKKKTERKKAGTHTVMSARAYSPLLAGTSTGRAICLPL